MRDSFKVVSVLAFTILIASVPLLAHHGASAFDTGKKITLKGTVTQWFWANPHCFLKFDVNGDNGALVHWIAETSNPPDMLNLGWSKQSLKPGDQVSVTLEPVKNGRPVGRVLEVIFADGKTLHASGRPPSTGSGPVSGPKPGYDDKQ